MAIVAETVSLTSDTIEAVRQRADELGLDGWLLYNFRDNNPVASRLLGLPAMTRRYFVWLPVKGTPVAITHRIEQQPWSTWEGDNQPYSSWRELDTVLAQTVGGKRVAMEFAENDAVPYVDRVPAGVIDLIRAAGAQVETSADLVSAFYSAWSAEGEAGHRRAAKIVRDVAHDAFRKVADTLRSGGQTGEWEIRNWVRDQLIGRGLKVGSDADIAVNANAANPHYAATAEAHAEIKEGGLLLIDLWGKEDDAAIYADQTWMGFVGDTVPDRLAGIFATLAAARDAAIRHVIDRSAAGHAVRGFEADDVARAVIEKGGYGPNFIHRTGHSIDRDLHGSGPNIDNLETKDTRTLIRGVGFSIEPGIYIPGDVGFRTEVNMFMGAHGPEVTTADPQRALYPLLRENPFA
ncbi:MAG TPA: M24 family metallopeptidase [Longimicrobium sp.]|nr:M24 family metallopeptidase [Longimicrobium sp.]